MRQSASLQQIGMSSPPPLRDARGAARTGLLGKENYKSASWQGIILVFSEFPWIFYPSLFQFSEEDQSLQQHQVSNLTVFFKNFLCLLA